MSSLGPFDGVHGKLKLHLLGSGRGIPDPTPEAVRDHLWKRRIERLSPVGLELYSFGGELDEVWAHIERMVVPGAPAPRLRLIRLQSEPVLSPRHGLSITQYGGNGEQKQARAGDISDRPSLFRGPSTDARYAARRCNAAERQQRGQ